MDELEVLEDLERGLDDESGAAVLDGYTVRLSSTGQKTEEREMIYKGTLWNSSMRSRWGKTPEEIEVKFTSYYSSGGPKVYTVTIIVDSNVEYWLLHRYS